MSVRSVLLSRWMVGCKLPWIWTICLLIIRTSYLNECGNIW